MQKPVEKPIKFKKNAATLGKIYPVTHIEAVIDGNGKTLPDILELMLSTIPSTSGDIMSYTDSEGNTRYIASTDDPSGIVGGGGMTELTWLELKTLRDNSQLAAGSLYRITDYQCTTTQENTQSAGHQFDIVLLALSEDKLAEEGWAMEHPTDVYDVTFVDSGTVSKCYIYYDGSYYNIVRVSDLIGASNIITNITINEENKTAIIEDDEEVIMTEENLQYSYFQNSNLSAWKVWYCLDNDKSRFAWADDRYSFAYGSRVYNRAIEKDFEESNTKYFAYDGVVQENFNDIVTIFFTSEVPKEGDIMYRIFGTVTPIGSIEVPIDVKINGRGVIYRLIDEFNNDIKYDFKNIQFKRKITDGQYDANGTDTWCYTLNVWYNNMCQDASIVGNILPNDEGYITGVYDNKFGYATAYDLYIDGVNTFAFALGDNVVLSFDDEDLYYGIYSNTIGNNSHSNTIGNVSHSNMIGNYFRANTIGNYFRTNTIGNYFSFNTIGDDFYSNTIGNDFDNRTISDSTSYKNYGNNGVELATKV